LTKRPTGKAELIDKYEKTTPYDIASVWAYRNDTEQTITWIKKAEEYQDTGLAESPYDPLFASIVDDPRWQQFL
jgi:hypothetical protein